MEGTRKPTQLDTRGRVRPKITIRTAANRFDLNQDAIPAGMTYEWKRYTVLGKVDSEHGINCEANGWTAVPAERHPELSGFRPGVSDDKERAKSIIRGGLVLCERPAEYTEESRRMEKEAARFQVVSQLERLRLIGHRAHPKGIKRQVEDMSDVA